MPIGPARLSLLPFPQSWKAGKLEVRFLCLPKGDPTAPLKPGLPAFAAANLVFEAKVIGSLDRLPLTGDATPVGPLFPEAPPDNKADVFDELTRQFKITKPPGPARAQPPKFRKVITESYRALIGNRQHSPYLADLEEFQCALHEGALDQPPDPITVSDEVTWGMVIAFALRQPNLAAALGLVVQTTVEPPDPAFFAAGGWLYINLHPTSDYAATPDIAAHYAARIPPLTADPRALFAPLLFPVHEVPGPFILDDVFREAERYEDGLAKQVHCAQSIGRADSIQLAWDDEQIAEWLNRQVDRPGGELKIDVPNGVSGYRVDVRRVGDQEWNSLVGIESLGDLQLGPLPLGPFRGEGVIEVTPAQLSPKRDGDFWFPSYFATWRGKSLALTDGDLIKLHARPDVRNAETPPHLLDREKNFAPVGDTLVRLLYGNTYEFRVRMSDLTRGGPGADIFSPDPPRNSIASLTFQRHKPPGPIEILKRPDEPPTRQVKIAKPRLGYPEVLFTGAKTFGDLELDLDFLAVQDTITREVSLPDPDVLTVEIRVQVKTLDGDADVYLPLYDTTRTFDADEMTIRLDIQDHPTLITIDELQPGDGPLVLPAARDLRLTLIGMGRDDAGYFVDTTARKGVPVTLDVRANSDAEEPLITEPEAFSALRSFFFQPPPPDNSVASPIERLAAEMKVDQNGLTLSGRSGHRTVLACSAELRHTLSPEASAITFASAADLIQRWISVMQFTLLRDWTWNGLDDAGIAVTRIVHYPDGEDISEVAGHITLPHAIGKKSIAGVPFEPREPIRQSTTLIFFDAFDPKPKPPRQFPSEITVEYVLEPAYKGPPPPNPISQSILLPVTTPPSQVPRILSAGYALSKFVPAEDYSATEPRQRSVWFEFAEPPADPDDAYFVRVRAIGPDPLILQRDFVPPDVVETPLPLDPEWMRLITPNQPRDENGLAAMGQLDDAPPLAGAHYLVPLPADLKESSPELFGFFVYEVRLGHTNSRWSTAQGRFGPMLRIAGVQHPPPPLICQAARSKTHILVRAPFATPVLNGTSVRPFVPVTELWALLYARVPQTDAAAWRNVLLTRTQLFAPHNFLDEVNGDPRILYGECLIDLAGVTAALRRLGLAADTPLTVLAAELFADPPERDPLGERLGHGRILRISPLVPVPDAC